MSPRYPHPAPRHIKCVYSVPIPLGKSPILFFFEVVQLLFREHSMTGWFVLHTTNTLDTIERIVSRTITIITIILPIVYYYYYNNDRFNDNDCGEDSNDDSRNHQYSSIISFFLFFLNLVQPSISVSAVVEVFPGSKVDISVTGTFPINTSIMKNASDLVLTSNSDLVHFYPDEEGNYTCVATNKYGFDSREFSVIFKGKTKAASEKSGQ